MSADFEREHPVSYTHLDVYKRQDYFQVSVDYLIGYSDNPSRAETSRDLGAEQLLGLSLIHL